VSWIENLGKMAKSAVDFTGLPGLFKDLATAGSNDDPWYVDGINLAKNTIKVSTTPVRAAVGGLLAVGEASYELGGKVRREGVEAILDQPFMYNKFKNQNESYSDYTARVEREKENISLGQATLSILSPGKNSGDKSGWLQDWTDNNLKFLSAGFDLFDPTDRETAFQNQYTGKFLSGIQDITASTIIDPLTFTGFIGKGAVIAAKAPMLDTISGKTARAVFGKFAMTEDRLDGLLVKALDGEGEAVADIKFLANSGAREQYEYWRKKKVTNPDAMAYLFGRAGTDQEVVDTFRAVMFKDTDAISKIVDVDDEAGLVLDAMNDVPHPHRMLLEGKSEGDMITSPKYNEVLQGYISRASTEDDRFRVALETVQTGGQFKYGFSRGPWEGKLAQKSKAKAARTFAEPESVLIQKTSLHPIIKVVNYFKDEMPSGVFNVNDGDSYTEFNAFLGEVNNLSKGGFGARAAYYADQYLGAASAGERNGVIQRAEKEALATLFPNYDQATVDSLYAIFDYRRASRIKAHRDQGFVSYLENGQVINAVSPVLQRESANFVIIADMRKLTRAIKAHEGILPGLLDGIDVQDLTMRTDKGLAALGTINDIFKTSVLMRLGYTVRNITEAQLSMLAKGFAMPAMVAAGGKDAVGRFFKNRQVGFTRLIDQVNINAGRADDVSTLQYAFMSEVDKLRAVDMSRKQLAKAISTRIGELERDAFKQRFTPGVGPLTVEDEVRTLKGVLADLESITLYHGSATGAFKLDESRSIAMSASPAIARRYAQGGQIVSIEQYIPTKTGRPGRLGEKPTPEGGTLPTEKRAAVLDEAMIALQTDMIDAVNAGRLVEVKDRAGKWRRVNSIDYRTLVLATESDDLETVLFKDWTRRPVFRVNYSQGNVQPIRVYGPSLFMTRWSELPMDVRALFNNKASEFNAWNKSKGWQDQNSPVYKYLRENGYGNAVVLDDKRAGGVSYIVLPESVDAAGRKREVTRSVTEMEQRAQIQAAEDLPELGLEPRMVTPKERRDARHAAKKAARRPNNAISPYYNKDNVNAAINNGVEDAAENLARLFTLSHAHLDDMSERLGAAITRAESNAIKQRTGYGYMDIEAGGYKYNVPEVFQDASWFMGRTSAEDTWNAMVATQEMAFTTGIGARTVAPVKPSDPRYFEAWANVLNMHFRDPETGIMDPVVRRILDGDTDEDILGWMTRNFEGRKYANDTYTTPRQSFGFTALKGGELDEDLLEKINITRGAVKVYIPDEETALVLSRVKEEDGKVISGGEVQNWLRDRFGSNPESLPEINGLLVTTSKEYRDQERLIDTFNRRVMRFLGSMPEDVFARHPLVRATYNRRIKGNIEAMAAAKGTEKLTAEEIDRATRGAREEARREVERTLFTIVRRSRASSSQVMQLMFPFFAAYENTMKRWSGIIAENPTAVATAGRVIAQIVNGQTVIDQDGNRITDAKKLSEEGMANLVIQVPQGFIDSLPKAWREVAQNSFKSVSIPLSSLDVITQGQPGNPGFGPYAVLPTYLIVRNRPELEDAFRPLFPAGQPQNAFDLFTPAALRRLRTMWTQDELYVRTFNQMLRYETYNFNSGKRTDEPTLDEIRDKTNKFFMLRALGSISLPVAVSPETDFYQQTFRQFMTQYGPGEAEAKFLEMYPDFFEATVSLSKSPGGLEANIDTVRNLKKFQNLMANAEANDNPELIGFLANDFDGQYTFSQAAYQWQYRQGAYPGSKNTYRQNRSPEELLRDANIKRGWTQFNSLMGQINTYKIQNGIVSDNDDALKPVNAAKKLWLRQMAEDNLDWYSEYISPDRGKYERRAQVLETALADKKWMAQNGNRPVVKAMAVYLDARKQLGNLLQQRERAGGSRMLEAKSNADVVFVLDQVRTQLIAESPEFEEFMNRYFINDTVVV
jgi:hypothetical protein